MAPAILLKDLDRSNVELPETKYLNIDKEKVGLIKIIVCFHFHRLWKIDFTLFQFTLENTSNAFGFLIDFITKMKFKKLIMNEMSL